MSDGLISRSKAKEELLSWAVVINKPDLLSREDALTVLDMMPAVDAVPVVHGRWERGFNLKPTCSVCGEYHLYSWSDHKNCNYCPNCGAKMDGKETERQ